MSSLVPGINRVVFWKLLIKDGGFFSVLFLVVLNHWTLSLPDKFFILIPLFLPGVSMIPILCKIQVLSSVLSLELKGPCGLLGITENDHQSAPEIFDRMFLHRNKQWRDACAIKYTPLPCECENRWCFD